MQEVSRDKLEEDVIKYQYLVYKIVSKFDYGYIDKEDLVQAGLVGLYKGLLNLNNKYNPLKFLSIYITSEIKNELRCNKLVVLSKEIIRVIKKIKNFDYLNMSIEKLSTLINESKENTLISLEYINNISHFNICDSYSNLKYALKCLNKKEREYIFNRYYLNKKQTEISCVTNKSQSAISRFEKEILEKIKKMIV